MLGQAGAGTAVRVGMQVWPVDARAGLRAGRGRVQQQTQARGGKRENEFARCERRWGELDCGET
jgi:hypothetical protein